MSILALHRQHGHVAEQVMVCPTPTFPRKRLSGRDENHGEHLAQGDARIRGNFPERPKRIISRTYTPEGCTCELFHPIDTSRIRT